MRMGVGSHRVVPSSLLEFLCDTLEFRTVLLCADVSSEAALARGDDILDLLVQLRDVPIQLKLGTAQMRRDQTYSARASTVPWSAGVNGVSSFKMSLKYLASFSTRLHVSRVCSLLLDTSFHRVHDQYKRLDTV